VPNQKFGGRQFTDDIQSEHHRARAYVDENGRNTHTYRAKYEIHPQYLKFVDELAENEDDELFEKDRGNMRKFEGKDARKYLSAIDRAKQQVVEVRRSLTQIDFLEELFDFENYYKTGNPQKTTFNVLFEGDS